MWLTLQVHSLNLEILLVSRRTVSRLSLTCWRTELFKLAYFPQKCFDVAHTVTSLEVENSIFSTSPSAHVPSFYQDAQQTLCFAIDSVRHFVQ